MPDMTFAPGVTSSPTDWTTLFNALDRFAITSFSASQIVFSHGAGQPSFQINGNGFVMGSMFIAAGTIDTIAYSDLGTTQITFANLALSAAALHEAAFNDNLGPFPDALENLLLPLGWTFNGNANADILLTTATNTDGVVLNMSGADRFNLNGGNDTVWMGDGDDKGYGGAGADTIDGGAGHDRVMGGLHGERLIGGTGNDTLNGGGGRDAFVFNLGDGSDQITQFDPERDRIDLAPSLTHSFANISGDLAIDYGPGDRILLLGVDFADAGLILIV